MMTGRDLARCVVSCSLASTVVSLAAIVAAAPADAGDFSLWNHFRTSALQPGDLATVCVENPHGPGLANTVLFLDGAVQAAALAPVVDGPSTLEALVPGPVAGRRYYGFRLEQEGQVDLLPVRLANGATPAPGLLSLLADDPVGDEVFGRPHLDLVSCHVSFSETRLYAALQNAGGGFPVSQSLTFFAYLFGLSNPAEPDPEIVWALIQTVDSPGIIVPGLYRVEGTGLSDLHKIGDITLQEFPEQNTLMLSCLLGDLLGDPAFAAWFDPDDPQAAVGAFTQRITLLGGTQEADRIEGGRLHLRALSRDPGPNTLPQLSDLSIAPPGLQAAAEVLYADADGHCPVLAELVLTGSDGEIGIYPLYPQTLDYSGAVLYRSEPGLPPLVSGSWTGAEARFSDNATDVVSLTLAPTSVSDGRAGAGPQLRIDGSPNPFAGQAIFSFDLPVSGPVRLTIHDVRGRVVAVLCDGERPAGPHAIAWDGRNRQGERQPAGVYFYRLQTGRGEVVRRIMMMR